MADDAPGSGNAETNPLLAAALAAAARGWRVLACYGVLRAPGIVAGKEYRCACPRAFDCDKNAGKHPHRVLCPNGQTDATSDPAVLRDWWSRVPDASPAVVMVPSGLMAFDLDFYKGDREKLVALTSAVGVELPDGPLQISGSGKGAHAIFRAPPHAVVGELGGITIRANNYIVLAPSPHKSGGRYAWHPGFSPDDVAVPELPVEWARALRRADPVGDVGVPPEDDEPAWLREIPHDRRVADMVAHLRSEPGERMGVDRAGTAWNVARTAARGFAVRDPSAVLAAMVEEYDPRCVPPYGEVKMAERVANAYEKATDPAWGARYDPDPTGFGAVLDAARRYSTPIHDPAPPADPIADISATPLQFPVSPHFPDPENAPARETVPDFSAFLAASRPPDAAPPTPTENPPGVFLASNPDAEISNADLRARLKVEQRRLSRSNDPRQVRDSELLKRALDGAAAASIDDDPDEAANRAVCAVVRAAPAATPAQVAAVLMRSLSHPVAAVEEVAREVRAALATAPLGGSGAAPRQPRTALAEDAPPRDDADLRSRLIPGGKDSDLPRSSGKNVELVLRWSAETRGRLTFDAIRKDVAFSAGRFAGEAVNDLHVAVSNWLEADWGIFMASKVVGEQLRRSARRWGYRDPLAEYLRGLAWDGTPRLGSGHLDDESDAGIGWLTRFARVEDAPHARLFGRRWMISAVARALDPGCKADDVLILEGEQSFKKSTLFDVLGGPWFSGSPVDINSKDGRMATSRFWIIEMAELASMRRAETEAQKAFFSSRVDEYRPPYGSAIEEFPRRCVFGATTNEHEYLQDETGNRRYRAVRVTDVVDAGGLQRARDQLWAEAVALYLAGRVGAGCAACDAAREDDVRKRCELHRWWLEPDENKRVAHVAADRMVEDSWVDPILAWWDRLGRATEIGAAAGALGQKSPGAQMRARGFTLAECAEGALGIKTADVKRVQHQVASALRRAGFRKSRPRSGDGRRGKVWVRLEATDDGDADAPDERPVVVDLRAGKNEADDLAAAGKPGAGPGV